MNFSPYLFPSEKFYDIRVVFVPGRCTGAIRAAIRHQRREDAPRHPVPPSGRQRQTVSWFIIKKYFLPFLPISKTTGIFDNFFKRRVFGFAKILACCITHLLHCAWICVCGSRFPDFSFILEVKVEALISCVRVSRFLTFCSNIKPLLTFFEHIWQEVASVVKIVWTIFGLIDFEIGRK